MRFVAAVAGAILAFGCLAAEPSANYAAPREGSWTVRDFRFHTGEVLPELRLHYTTVGAPTGLIIDSIRRYPANAQFASVFYGFATNGGDQALHKAAPTREKADQLLDARLKAPFRADPTDVLYQWDSSRDYNPSPGLDKIQAVLLAINSADDAARPIPPGTARRDRPSGGRTTSTRC